MGICHLADLARRPRPSQTTTPDAAPVIPQAVPNGQICAAAALPELHVPAIHIGYARACGLLGGHGPCRVARRAVPEPCRQRWAASFWWAWR